MFKRITLPPSTKTLPEPLTGPDCIFLASQLSPRVSSLTTASPHAARTVSLCHVLLPCFCGTRPTTALWGFCGRPIFEALYVWKLFLFYSYSIESLPEYWILGWKSFAFRILKALLYLIFCVTVEKSKAILMPYPLMYLFSSLEPYRIVYVYWMWNFMTIGAYFFHCAGRWWACSIGKHVSLSPGLSFFP